MGKVVSVRISGHKGGYPSYSVAEYEAVPRKEDGVPTWRLVCDLYDANRGIVRAEKAMKEIAERRGVPYCTGIRHGQEVLHNWK